MTSNFLKEKIEELKKRTKTERGLGKLHAEAEIPRPLMLDEVSASFISWLRVNSWENLGDEFGGYKIGRILAYILDLICTEIEDSTAATIKIDVPLYEQCPIIKTNEDGCKCGGKCKHNEEPKEEEGKFCQYCFNTNGTKNYDVFIKTNDDDYGDIWLCKECFLAAENEKDEQMSKYIQQINLKNNRFKSIKKLICEPIGAKTEPQMIKNQSERLSKIYKLAKEGLEEEVFEWE